MRNFHSQWHEVKTRGESTLLYLKKSLTSIFLNKLTYVMAHYLPELLIFLHISITDLEN